MTEPTANFNKSSVDVIDSCFSPLAPALSILHDDDRVLLEERLSGVALNRLSSELF